MIFNQGRLRRSIRRAQTSRTKSRHKGSTFMAKISRRSFLKAAGSASVLPGIVGAGALGVIAEAEAAKKPKKGKPSKSGYLFFTAAEMAFIQPACARLIPLDELGPGAVEAGVPNYLDQQLGGAWGAGERLYRSGPWQIGKPQQGYQLPFTPAELFRNALRGIQADLKNSNRNFGQLSTADQDTYLKALETESKDLGGVPSNIFFQSLLELTIEGFFSDPVY